MKINEQDSNQFSTVEEAEDAGFTLDRPSDYTSEKYDMIEVEGFRMYRLKDQETDDSRSDEEPEQDQQTDSDTTERQDAEDEPSRPSSSGSLTVSESHFCMRCTDGNSIEECDTNMGFDVYGSCNLFDRRKIAEEIDSRMTYEGLPSFNIKSLKQKGNKLYFEGEGKDMETKKLFELKKGIVDGNLTWMFLDEDGKMKDFFTGYHLNENFLKNKKGLKFLLEKYRIN